MRMLVNVLLPVEPFNSMVRNGTAGDVIGSILEDLKPESVYFTEHGGERGAVMVMDVPDPSYIPTIAEPWFLNFEANCEFKIAMSPEDLMKADLSGLAKKWG
ncbi:panthothenate synthetase [Puteibacter caeruleilacunae]|nr:panthothenate synthetase [Puteibacter caeruleilacunae]